MSRAFAIANGLIQALQAQSEEVGRLREVSTYFSDKVYTAEEALRLERAKQPAGPTPLSLGYLNGLITAVSSGDKIGAIKAVRAMANIGLKEAKDIVEAAWPYPKAALSPFPQHNGA